jgi:hypothetical protein
MPDIELMKIVDRNIKKLRDGGFLVDNERAERLSKDLPNHENILDTVANTIETYQATKRIPETRLHEIFLAKCASAFDKAILKGVLTHKDNWREPDNGSQETNESLLGKDLNVMSPTPRFDAFVSYSDLTGKKYAETIRDTLGRYRITTFVAHIEQPKYTGEFRKIVDSVISNCRNFILLINIDTLERPEVILEVKTAYPNGRAQFPNLVVFRQGNVKRDSQDFLNETRIDLSQENQHDFNDTGELATRVISLYKAGEFTRTYPEPIPQPLKEGSVDRPIVEDAVTVGQDQRNKGARSEKDISEEKAKIKEFKAKLTRCNLWRYFDVKGFLYKTQTSDQWKFQLMNVALHGSKPNSLGGVRTEHLELVQVVQEIDKLDDLLDQIADGNKIAIDDVSGSLELMKNKIREGSYYIDHPQTKLFGIHNASLALLKPGDTSSELFDNDRTILRELGDKYETLPDAVANILALPFWDGSYSPFVTVFAPFPLEIIDLKLTDTSIKATLSSSPLIDLDALELKLVIKDHNGRQIGEAQKITGFRRNRNTGIIIESDLTGINTGEFGVLKLSYCDNLIQEKSYGRKRATATWYPLN